MTTPADFPDFTQGVSVLDQAVSVYGNTVQQVNPNGGFSIDTSRAASMTVVLLPSFSGVNAREVLALQWAEAGVPMGWDELSFHNASAYALQQWSQLGWQVPCRGSAVQATLISNDITWTGAYVILSTRAIPEPVVTVGNLPASKLLLNYGVNIAAGASTPVLYVPPVSRAIAVSSSYGITAGTINVNGVYSDAAMALHADRLTRIATTANGNFVTEIPASFIGLELTITNNDAAVHSGSVQVWDVS